MANELILIVDDQPENISVLYDFLISIAGYNVLVATNGQDALTISETRHPGLVLLDVMMPGMNGFEVCQKLKANVDTVHIPIIFITALTDMTNKLEGFKVGGADYLTKPFQQEEVLARVNTHLLLSRQRKVLAQKNNELNIRNKELDAFAHTVAHDLKNPLSAIMSNAELLGMLGEEIDNDEFAESALAIRKASAKAADIIESLLLLAGTSHHCALHYEPFPMGFIVDRCLDSLEAELKAQACVVQKPQEWPVVSGYPAWVEEIWVNYMTNALKYGGIPPQIEIGCEEMDGFARFWVRDNGAGLTPEQQAQLFTPFTRLHTKRASGHGLGLTIVERIVQKLGGQAGVESQAGQGSTFYFTLPYKHAVPEEMQLEQEAE